MTDSILWQTQSSTSLEEQFAAIQNIYPQHRHVGQSFRRKLRWAFLGLIVLNILAGWMMKNFWEGNLFLKIVGLNVLILATVVIGWKVYLSRFASHSEVRKQKIESHQVILKEEGFFCQKVFMAWEDIQDYLITDGWLFLKNRQEALFATKVGHLSESETQQLLQIFSERVPITSAK